MAKALLDYVTSIGFELLPSSRHEEDMPRDMHGFMVLPIVRAMYHESFSIHQALQGQRLPNELRCKLWENSLVGKNGFKYVNRVKVFIKETVILKSGQMSIYGVIYFTKVLQIIMLSLADSILVKI